MSERLPAGLEVSALIRRIQAEGGFATVLRKGDPDRGAISLLVAERGRERAVLERRLGPDFAYRWTEVPLPDAPDGSSWRNWAAETSRIDPDCWIVELDIPDAERFIAETTATG